MPGESSRFTSDQRVPEEASWSTEDDWGAGTPENVDVIGNGLVGRAPTQGSVASSVVDDFERDSLAFYSGDTGNFEVQSDIAYTGDFALRCITGSTSGSDLLYSLSGLDSYPEAGDVISLWTRTDEENASLARPTFLFGIQPGADEGYSGTLRYPHNGQPAEFKSNYAGYHSLDYNYRLGEWYQIRIDWGSSGDFVVEIYGEDGSLLDGPLVGNDSRWSSGGIGFNSAGTADEVYDYVVLE
ncbi:hypothetical protein [Halorubrum laminariae]|uniref:LamG domain-containing protein n=1 Tax=Halorubrum laminariae TaxID=1433523 RepID=A0ABD6C1R6_9EURY|nr:hypothetical protein [Halorubrum laminariae]